VPAVAGPPGRARGLRLCWHDHGPDAGVHRLVLMPSAAHMGSGRTPYGYGLVVAVLVAGVLLLFGLVEWAALPILTDPLPVMRAAGLGAALIGVGILTIDVLLPVPSSVVMVAHGALFGLVPGAALSLLGGVGATLIAFLLGRRGRPVVERLTTSPQRHRAGRLLSRWGALAVLITRPVPVVAETVAVLAGTSPMRWSVAAVAGAAGTVPPAVLYAAVGASGGTAVEAVLVLGIGMFPLLLAVVAVTRRRSAHGHGAPRAQRGSGGDTGITPR
jgi:uncharacterized membrane protein YdjX (TVP38/TMEM64 family)